MKTSTLTLACQQGLLGLEKIESAWHELFCSLSEPMYSQSPIWHKAYLRHLCNTDQHCYYFCVYRGNKLLAIFPLEYRVQTFYFLKLKTLAFSNHDHFGINSVIIDEKESTEKIFDFLYNKLKKQSPVKWSLIYLERCIQHTQAANCKISQTHLLYSNSGTVCDVLPILPEEAFMQGLSRNFKGNLKKSKNRLHKLENVTYRDSLREGKLDSFYQTFLNIESSGWKGSSGQNSAIKLNTSLKQFYEEAIHEFDKNGQAEINILYAENKAIAVQYAVIIKPSVFLLKIGYDEAYANYSPGNLLIHHKIEEYAQHSDLKCLNLISDAPWHSRWHPHILTSENIYNCKNSQIMIYLKLALTIKDKIKALRNQKADIFKIKFGKK